jgi:hypothetical protein
MILVTRPNYLKLHKLTICLAVWHVVGNQKPLKGHHLIEWFKINKMQANPDKFQVLAVGKKTYEKRPTINIQSQPSYSEHY